MKPPPDVLLTVDELRERLRISRSYAYRLAHRIGRTKIGDCVRVSERDLEAYLAKNKERPWDGYTNDTKADRTTATTTPPRASESAAASRRPTSTSPKNDSDLPSWLDPPRKRAGGGRG